MALFAFSWVIENKLAGMAMPTGSKGDFEELKNRGITGLVTLTMEPVLQRGATEYDIEYLHLPVPDFAPPLQVQIQRFVDFCNEHIEDGGAVAAHCRAGRGRTGTMLACYLVSKGSGPQEAISEIRRLRRGSIETLSQESAVYQYAEEMEEAE